jgi:pilus assembly protein Flp/PilA
MQKSEPATAAFVLFVRDESGQDLIEYVLVASLIGVGAVSAMTNLGGKLRNVFNAISNNLASS